MKIFMIVGVGANNIEMPAIFFTNKAEADALAEKINARCLDTRYHSLRKEDQKLLYTRYYAGDDGIGHVYVTEVEEGKPFVGFDLY